MLIAFDRSGAAVVMTKIRPRLSCHVPMDRPAFDTSPCIRQKVGMRLTKLIFDAERKAVSTRALDEAINLLEARASLLSEVSDAPSAWWWKRSGHY